MDTSDTYTAELLAGATADLGWDVDAELPDVSLHHKARAERHVQVGPSEWSVEPVQRIWTELPNGLLMASRELARDVESPEELRAAVVAVLDETRAQLAAECASTALNRRDVGRIITQAAHAYAEHLTSPRETAPAAIRWAYAFQGVSAETLTETIAHVLTAAPKKSGAPGLLRPEFPQETAEAWVREALAPLTRNAYTGEVRGVTDDDQEALVRALHAVTRARDESLELVAEHSRRLAEQAAEAAVKRDRAIQDALAHGMTQVDVARATGLTQGRVAQIAAKASASRD